MFCKNCGAEVKEGAQFCPKCGTRIEHRKTDIDERNSEDVLNKNIPIQSQKSVEKISGKRTNKIAIALIIVIVISVVAGGVVYTQIWRTNAENAENIAENMQDLPAHWENEQPIEDLPEQQKKEQSASEIVKADNEEADEARNVAKEAQNDPKEMPMPQVIQLDSRYIRNIQASSELTDSTKTYKVGFVLDGNTETCWSEGVSGAGEGESIYIEFTSPVYISEVAFLNGYLKNEKVYNANGKIKRAELKFDGDSYEVDFNDWQYQEIENFLYSDRFTMDTPIRTQSLTIIILEAQNGTKYEDTCLTELAIWGYADDTDGGISAAGVSAEERF